MLWLHRDGWRLIKSRGVGEKELLFGGRDAMISSKRNTGTFAVMYDCAADLATEIWASDAIRLELDRV